MYALEEGSVDAGRHMKLWMEVGSWGGVRNAAFDLLLKSTVMDRSHCLVVVSSDELSKRWRGGNNNGVTLSGAGGS